MKKVYEVKIQHDYETSERAGAGGMFQIISVTGIVDNDEEVDFDKLDNGTHYFKNEDVLKDLQELYSEYDFSTAELSDDD
ncbi:MAG: hypothetical protein SPE14_02370 [Anaerovibrio sp.]|nr:hypothetical protein [Anaerovibrio sp.]